jgi:hypothetical protein
MRRAGWTISRLRPDRRGGPSHEEACRRVEKAVPVPTSVRSGHRRLAKESRAGQRSSRTASIANRRHLATAEYQVKTRNVVPYQVNDKKGQDSTRSWRMGNGNSLGRAAPREPGRELLDWTGAGSGRAGWAGRGSNVLRGQRGRREDRREVVQSQNQGLERSARCDEIMVRIARFPAGDRPPDRRQRLDTSRLRSDSS